MSSTDDRIVKMQFDNGQFKRGAAETQKALTDVDKALGKAGGNKGLLSLDSQMQKVQVTASKMQIAVATAIGNVTNRVVNSGISMIKSLTFDPISQGFNEYEASLTKLNTIMNATGLSQREVSKVLQELNHYSDQTIYSFSNMTESITKFVNAGVPLKDAAESVKGIANAAAFAGASTDDANRAMFALSQSISNGFLTLGDFNQLEAANMATVQFKNTLLEAAVANGTLNKEGDKYITASGKAITATQGFQYSLQEQWASTNVLNDALAMYTDQNTKLGRKAAEAATEVRTYTAFIDTLKESIGSGWSGIFKALIGNLGDATKFWTGLSNAIGGGVSSVFDWLTVTLKTWRRMGGFEKTMEGFKNLLAPIGALLGVVGDAFRKAFPDSDRGSGKVLYGLSAAFAAITYPLKLLADLISGSIGPLTFFFKIVKIGVEVVKTGAGLIGDFVSSVLGLVDIKAPSSSGNSFIGWIKALVQSVGDAVDQISDLLDKGESVKKAFGSVDIDLPKIPRLPAFDAGLSSNIKAPSIDTSSVDTDVLTRAGAAVKDAGAQMQEGAADAGSAASTFVGWLGSMADGVKSFLGRIDMEEVMSAMNLGILATFMLSLSRFLNRMSNIGGVADGFNQALEGIGESLTRFSKAQQREATAKVILNTAIALGVLVAAVWVLSKIPVDKLIFSLLALATISLILKRAMSGMADALGEMEGIGGAAKMIALSFGIVAFAGAMVLMAAAIKILDGVGWDGLIKGAIAMELMNRAMEKMAEIDSAGMVRAAFAMGIMSGSLLLFALALKVFAKLDIGEFVKGLVLIAASLAVLIVALNALQTGILGAAAMVVVASALIIFAGAVALFAKMKWGTFFKGILLIALALTVLVVALNALQSGIAGALALLIIVPALFMLVAVIKAFSMLDWGTFFKGIGMLTIAMGTFALMMTILGVLSPMIMLASAALIMFGVAMALVGGGVALLAAGLTTLVALGGAAGLALIAFATAAVTAIAVFLQSLALQAPVMKKSILALLQTLLDAIVEAVPMVIRAIKDLWAAVQKELGGGGGKGGGGPKAKFMGDTGEGWIERLANAIRDKVPLITRKAVEIFVAFLQGLRSRINQLTEAAVDLIVAFAASLGKQNDRLVAAAVGLILKFAESLGKQIKTITDAGIQLIADFLHGLADSIRSGAGKIGAGISDVVDAMRDVGVDIVKGMIGGIGSMFGDATSAIGSVASGMVDKAKSVLKIFSPSRVFMDIGKFLVQGLSKGVQNNASSAILSVAQMVGGQIALATDYINRMIQNLDQKAIAARGRAQGLALAAAKAEKAAKKTETKADDKGAKRLDRQSDAADKVADAAEARAEAQRRRRERTERFADASLIEKAKFRAEDAQNQLDAAKAAEQRAEKNRQAAVALVQQSKAKGLTEKERKALLKEAADLRAQARKDASAANVQLAAARKSAADALVLQRRAGAEAAAEFQKQYDEEARIAAEEDAFEQLTDAEKAAKRREQAQALQKKADEDLANAKKLAMTDLDAANDLAQKAMEQADQARAWLEEAQQFEQASLNGVSGGGGPMGTVVDIAPTEAAALAFNRYQDAYDAATAAAASTAPVVEFNQYNTSPESLSPTEIYRNTNNQLTFAAEKLAGNAA